MNGRGPVELHHMLGNGFDPPAPFMIIM
eukprot:SAG31_NODE_14080_length_828_cov_1.094650_1_plen_27_part_10